MPKFYSSNPVWFGASELRESYEASGTWPADARQITDEEEISLRASIASPQLTLSEVKANKVAELAAEFTQRMEAVKSGYPADEIQSWFDQKGEAVAYTADKNAATPLLSAMAGARGITVADLAARVLDNAAGYAATAGLFIGTRQKYEDAVNAAADADAVALVVWID